MANLFSAIRNKPLLPLLFLAFFTGGASQSGWKHVESFDYDWDGDGKPEKVTLDIAEDWQLGGEFSRFRLFFERQSPFVLQSKAGWIKYEKALPPQLRSTNSLANSEYVLALPFADGKPPLLFLFGWPYGSSPGSLHVVALQNRVPHVIFSRDEYELTEYADLDDDGQPELVGKACLTQEWGHGFRTYDPYTVYRLPEGNSRAVLSIPLSRKYNLQHYYGWAGPECSEELVVIKHPLTGKHVIMKAKDAEELYEKHPPKRP